MSGLASPGSCSSSSPASLSGSAPLAPRCDSSFYHRINFSRRQYNVVFVFIAKLSSSNTGLESDNRAGQPSLVELLSELGWEIFLLISPSYYLLFLGEMGG